MRKVYSTVYARENNDMIAEGGESVTNTTVCLKQSGSGAIGIGEGGIALGGIIGVNGSL